MSSTTEPVLLDSLFQEFTTGLCMNLLVQNYGCHRLLSEDSELVFLRVSKVTLKQPGLQKGIAISLINLFDLMNYRQQMI